VLHREGKHVDYVLCLIMDLDNFEGKHVDYVLCLIMDLDNFRCLYPGKNIVEYNYISLKRRQT
jgi:hypothetical protein